VRDDGEGPPAGGFCSVGHVETARLFQAEALADLGRG
jgi:hypothetical protein